VNELDPHAVSRGKEAFMTNQETTDRVFVLSADAHAAPRTEEYRPYFDGKYRDQFEEYLRVHHHRFTPGHEHSVYVPTVRDIWNGHEAYDLGDREGDWDPQIRLRAMDRQGVTAEIIFPDDTNWNAQPFCGGLEPQGLERPWPGELRLAGARAHNRWAAEFCGTAPDRLLGVTSLAALDDIDAAVAEIRRAYDAGLRTAVGLPLDYYLPLYHHERYDPLWRTCVELGLPVAIHGADGGPSWYGEGLRAVAIFMTEVTFYSHRPLWCMILGGVFDRFPELKVVFTEQGSDWVAPLLAGLDQMVHNPMFRFVEEDALELLPSEYWARNCWAANSLMRTADEYDRARAVPNLLFGTDYPHVEGIWPEVGAAMRQIVAGRDPAEVRAFLGLRGADVYDVDLARLRDVTARIGPSIGDFAEAHDEQAVLPLVVATTER
jgi:predicted TIM-barrel fold metal-dependent hydrolase